MSLQFNRFFTNSTSTEMTINDVLFGDSSVKDLCPTFAASKSHLDPVRFLGLPFECGNNGYRYLSFATSPYGVKREAVTQNVVAVNDPNVQVACEKALFHMAVAKLEKRPFFTYFWDNSSHLASRSPQKETVENVAEKIRIGYALVDASVNRLLAGMAQLGLWEDTIIIGFGDHGDEPWSHGLNRGYCHSLSPYASVCWTPMFIYDQGGLEVGKKDNLASAIDLRYTIWPLLFPEAPPLEKASPFSGIDLFRETRDIAFSQNMFALQREQCDPEKGMSKGYAATDGVYRLVVSSGANHPEQTGMSLYCDQADPSNSLNLLKFFKMDRHGTIQHFAHPPEAVGKHFSGVFGPSQVDSLIAAYNNLKPLLVQFIKKKEEEALERYQDIRTNSEEKLSQRLFDGYGRRHEYHDSSVTAKDYIPMATKIKTAISQSEPQLFPEKAFTVVAKAL